MGKRIIDESFFLTIGLKLTKQRLLLSKILFSGKNKHFAVRDLQKIVFKKGYKMSLATIYNNLQHFSKAGLLKKRNVGIYHSYFDNNVTDHYHLFDEDKKKLIDIPRTAIRFSKLPNIPKNRKIKNINLVINLEKK